MTVIKNIEVKKNNKIHQKFSLFNRVCYVYNSFAIVLLM
jgi:hypothetical protein